MVHSILLKNIPNVYTGMPYPQNVETARSVENIIREQGAIPATIAILDGKVHIGNKSLDKFTQLFTHSLKV